MKDKCNEHLRTFRGSQGEHKDVYIPRQSNIPKTKRILKVTREKQLIIHRGFSILSADFSSHLDARMQQPVYSDH